ncbi:MAG TPA: cytochrome c oxidase subunit II [Gaiellaceae bacterium]|jgi:cytochrome c oxidase subunit 2|nr:cytochrome c oxidase subunit II [Gaiellaceae bacterium]
MRRGSIASLLGIGVVAGGVAAAVALAIPWMPISASKEAGRIDFVFWFVVTICIVIFAVVAAAILYSVVRFRAAPDDDSDGPPIHGHTGLEIAWTLIPTVLVTAIGIVSAIVLSRDDAIAKNALHIQVIAQQFTWTFKYPDAHGLTSATLVLPNGREAVLDFQSKDVIHAFFVPEFRENMDVVPGLTTTINVTPTRVGTYPVICNELCGLGHATMRSTAQVMTPTAFDKWLKGQSKAVASPNPATAGAAVFKNNGCAACHTLAAASATGKVGPDLDKLPAEAQQAKQPLASFVRTSITDPNAYVAPGYPKNVMPATFGKAIPKQQLDALVSYLINSSK